MKSSGRLILVFLAAVALAGSVIPRAETPQRSDYYDTDADFDLRELRPAIVLTEGTVRGRALLDDERLAECYHLTRIDSLSYGTVQRVYCVRFHTTHTTPRRTP